MTYGERPNDPLFVEDVLTPLTEAEATYYLQEAFKKIAGEYPKLETLAILWAQSALEVGRWKFIHVNNWGNVKKLKDKPYTSYQCSEIINGKNIYFYPYHPQTFFAAWDGPEEGALAYLAFLKKPRYAKAWQQALVGDAVKYCLELKTAGYFTANLDHYTKGVVRLSEEFKKRSTELMSWKPEVKEVQPIVVPVIEDAKPVAENEAPSPEPQKSLGWLDLLLSLFKKFF